MKSHEENHIIFSELICGYSPVIHKDFGELFVRHISHLESLKIEKQYLYALEEARKQDIPSYLDREKLILSDGLWTKKEEISIKDTKDFIQTLKGSLSNDYLFSRRNHLKKEISDAEQRLDTLLMKKDYLIGTTSEKYARQKSLYYQICNCFYRDDKLSDKLIFNDIDESEYDELVNIFNKYCERINHNTIKYISLSSFFTNIFYMCGDNAYYFYGKPIVELTNHQTELFMYGRYFKNQMQQFGDRLPKNMTEPDDMIEWFEINQNVEKSGILKGDDENGGGGSIVGATKKDYEMMGVDMSQMVDMSKKIREAGGTLNKEQLMKMQT